jgi:hypothetical protein
MSRLFLQLSGAGAVTDPPAREQEGGAFIADTDIARDDETAVLSYVRNKYSRPKLLAFRPVKIMKAVSIEVDGLRRVLEKGTWSEPDQGCAFQWLSKAGAAA